MNLNPIPYVEPGWARPKAQGPESWAYTTLDLIRLAMRPASTIRKDQIFGPAPIARFSIGWIIHTYPRIRGKPMSREAVLRAWERWKNTCRDYGLERPDGYDEDHELKAGWFALDVLGAFDAIWAVLGPPHPLESAWAPLGGPGRGEEREFYLLDRGPLTPPGKAATRPEDWDYELDRHSAFYAGSPVPAETIGRDLRHYAIEPEIRTRLAQFEEHAKRARAQKQPWWLRLDMLTDMLGHSAVAKRLKTTPKRIDKWLLGERGVSKRTALNIERLWEAATKGGEFKRLVAPAPRIPGPRGGGMVARGHTRAIGLKRIPFWLGALREMRNTRFPGRGGGRKLAAHIGISPVSVTNLLKGKRVPGPAVMEKIMAAAGKKMPPWQKALRKIRDRYPSDREAAEAIGVAPVTFTNYLKGRAKPSEKTLELVFEAAGMKGFWVVATERGARGFPHTGARGGALGPLAMGELPREIPDDPYVKAIASLLVHFRSQRALAKDIGVSVTTFNKWLRGSGLPRHPSGATVVKIRKALLRHGLSVPGEIEQRFQVMEPRLAKLLEDYSSQAALARDLKMSPTRFTVVLDQRKRPTPQQNRRINKLLKERTRAAGNPAVLDPPIQAEGKFSQVALEHGVEAAEQEALAWEAQYGMRPWEATPSGLVGPDYAHVLLEGSREFGGIIDGASFYDPMRDEVVVVQPDESNLLVTIGPLHLEQALKSPDSWKKTLVDAVSLAINAYSAQGNGVVSQWLVLRVREAALGALAGALESPSWRGLLPRDPDVIWRELGKRWVMQPWGLGVSESLGGWT